jgi:hypothetical protein
MGKNKDVTASITKIFYLHVPKTGGQTLASRIASAFPLGQSDIMGMDFCYPNGVAELRHKLTTSSFVEGHVSGPVLSNCGDLDLMTTVREPVSQVISNYLHVLREPGNVLHRAAKQQPAERFFKDFGDLLANNQSRYLASAFFPVEIDSFEFQKFSLQLFAALDRIRWIVPTDLIDEFITLWTLENRLTVPYGNVYINVASRDDGYEYLLEVVRAMPELYAMDLLLYQEAKQRYYAYRAKILRDAGPLHSTDNASRAFFKDRSGIWLGRGWYYPEIIVGGEIRWWAGPDQLSEVGYSRSKNERYLKFSVHVVCGISFSDILAVRGNRRDLLPITSAEESDKSRAYYWIDLQSMPLKGSFYLWVPRVWSPIMLDSANRETRRQSFSSGEWEFVNQRG